MDAQILNARKRGVPVIGICGGYQMLGREIIDEGYESAKGTYAGLGLLDGVTRFVSYEKNTRQVTRKANNIQPILSEIGEVTGYEIHMGETQPGKDKEAFSGDGLVNEEGLVFGTYMHGLFQNLSAVNSLLSYLYSKKNVHFSHIHKAKKDIYDELAEIFESHVDMDAITKLLIE